MMVFCNDIVAVGYGWRRPGLSRSPVDIEHDNNRSEQRYISPLKLNYNLNLYPDNILTYVRTCTSVIYIDIDTITIKLNKRGKNLNMKYFSSQRAHCSAVSGLFLGTFIVYSGDERVIISMMVIRCVSDEIWYDRRTSELSNAVLHMKQDINIIEI